MGKKTTSFTPFQRHLLWYAEPHSPFRITILSGLQGSLKLGFNFPVSLLLSILIRITYSPSFIPFTPFPVGSVTRGRSRTQLEHVSQKFLSQSSYSHADLQSLYNTQLGSKDPLYRRSIPQKWIDKLHVWGWWAAAADVKTGRVEESDLERFQDGEWQGQVAVRRLSRLPGKGDVLPFWRGGPISVAGHSWAVKRFFDVDVYQGE